MKKIFAAILILLSVGCTTGRSLQLGPEWAPLVSVEEGTDKLLSEGMTTTIGQHCYVPDLKQWILDHPEGSVEREAILRHEQVHSRRQLTSNLAAWLAQYAIDKKFRWQEEQLGYEQQFRWLVKNNRIVNPVGFAIMVSEDYRGIDGQMCTYDEAYGWIMDLLTKIANGQ